MPVVGWAKGEISYHLPFCRIAAVNVGFHFQNGDALIDPWPTEVSKLYLQFWYLADTFIIGWTTVTPLLSIHENANMKHHIHAKLSDLSIERNDLRVVGIPVGRDHLDAA